MSTTSKLRTLVIGLDGASFELMDPLLKKGALPNISALISNGTRASLRSVWPPITPVAWPSYYTGQNPGKHGCLGFTKYKDAPDENAFDLTTYHTMDEVPFWDIFALEGQRCCLINLPITYPLPEVHGTCIGGLGAPDLDADLFYPPELREEIFGQIPEFSIGFDDEGAADFNEWVDEKLAQEATLFKAAQYMISKNEHEFLMVVFEAPDRVGHVSWQPVKDPDSVNEAEENKSGIDLVYEKMDEFIGKLTSSIDVDKTNILILSDHGFGPYKVEFMVNKWLERNGYLVMRKFSLREWIKDITLTFRAKSVSNIFRKLKLSWLASILPDAVSGLKLKVPVFKRRFTPKHVDWSKTRAYADNFGIFVNKVGREKTGIVSDGQESSDLILEITEKLKSLKDEQTGLHVIADVYEKSTLFSGAYASTACDINFCPDPEYVQNHGLIFDRGIFHRFPGGTHRPEGIFIASGPAFRKGFQSPEINIMDAMPITLKAADLPIPSGIDGRLIADFFTDEWLKNSNDNTIDAKPRTKSSDRDEDVYDEEQRQVIEARLKNLGYW